MYQRMVNWINYRIESVRHTVANMVEMVSKERYAPTTATAGLSFLHHQTAVVPNHTPAMIKTKLKEAMNAHGESPPVNNLPPRKKRFREGCNSYRRTCLPVLELMTGTAESGGYRLGGIGLKESSGEAEAAELREARTEMDCPPVKVWCCWIGEWLYCLEEGRVDGYPYALTPPSCWSSLGLDSNVGWPSAEWAGVRVLVDLRMESRLMPWPMLKTLSKLVLIALFVGFEVELLCWRLREGLELVAPPERMLLAETGRRGSRLCLMRLRDISWCWSSIVGSGPPSILSEILWWWSSEFEMGGNGWTSARSCGAAFEEEAVLGREYWGWYSGFEGLKKEAGGCIPPVWVALSGKRELVGEFGCVPGKLKERDEDMEERIMITSASLSLAIPLWGYRSFSYYSRSLLLLPHIVGHLPNTMHLNVSSMKVADQTVQVSLLLSIHVGKGRALWHQ